MASVKLIANDEATGKVKALYDLDVDGRRYRVIARIDDGAYTMPLAVPGRVLLSARQPVPAAPALVDAVTLAGPDAAVVELATG